MGQVRTNCQFVTKLLLQSTRAIQALGYDVPVEKVMLSILIPVAEGGFYPIAGILMSPILAGGAMACSLVSVVSNSLRLRCFRPHRWDRSHKLVCPGMPRR